MENLVDALYMAAAVLIFVIALTVSISSFTTTRAQIDDIVEMEEKMDLATDENYNYLNYISTSSDNIREVGIETLVSSMYRVAKENYVIYIKAEGLPEDTLMKLDDITMSRYELHATEQTFQDKKIIGTDDEVLYIDINGKNKNIDKLLKSGVYDALKDKKFKEYLGVYQQNTDANTSNRTTYRVITYVQI